VARGLLERETLDGEEDGRLVDTAYGGPVHEAGSTVVPHFAPSDPDPTVAGAPAPPTGNGGTGTSSDNGDYVTPAPEAGSAGTPAAD